MALTTTTVCLPAATRPATMEAVRLMAAGSSTEVPPNFITTRLMRCCRTSGQQPVSIANLFGTIEVVPCQYLVADRIYARLDVSASGSHRRDLPEGSGLS